MTTRTCPSCYHTWEEEISVPDWYKMIAALEGAKIPVPPYEHCAAWLDGHDGAWALAEEMATVVVDYWKPVKGKKGSQGPWLAFTRYIGKELRMKAERQEQKELRMKAERQEQKSGGMLKGGGRY